MAATTYKCDRCGGMMEYDVTSQTLKCPNCENTVQITEDGRRVEEHDLTKKAKRENKAQAHEKVTMCCEGCGATVEFDETCTANECPYCGANYVLAQKQTEDILPDGVLPFTVDKAEVGRIFQKWIKGRWLAPGELKHLYQQDKLVGVYIPYWTFDANADASYTAMGGKERKVTHKNSKGETETEIVVDWFFTKGRVHHQFDDVLEAASDKLKGHLLSGIEPYDTKRVVPYSPDYMAGYLSEVYTVDLETAHKSARTDMKSHMYQMAEQDVKRQYDRVKDVQLDVKYKDETYKHIMLPVYSTAFFYKGKQYAVLVNGQTGKMYGDYPKSPVKIAIIVAVIVAILAFVFFSQKSDACEYENTQQTITVYEDYTCFDIDAWEIENT